MIRYREIECGNCGFDYDDCEIITNKCPNCRSSKNQIPK